MARLGESPPSSEGVSLKGVSPETTITTYTPDDVRNGKATSSGTPPNVISTGLKPLIHALSARATPIQAAETSVARSLTPGVVGSNITIKGLNSLFDPFVEGMNTCARFEESASGLDSANDLRKLSATAKDFHPNQLLIRDSVPDIVSSTPLPKAGHELTVPKTPSKNVFFDYYNDFSPKGLASPHHDGPPYSTDGEIRRYIVVGNINYATITMIDIVLTKAGVYAETVDRITKFNLPCRIFLVFDDFRAAERAHAKAVSVGLGLTIRYITPLEFNSHCPKTLDEFSLNIFAGQVHLSARANGSRSPGWSSSTLRQACKDLAGVYGEVRTFAEMDAENDCKNFRVEFFSLSAAAEFLVAYGKGISHKDYLVTAQRYVPACVKKPTSQAMTRVDTGDSGIADMMSNLDLNKLTWAPTLSMATPQRITSTSPENQGPCGWYFSPTGRTRIPHAGAALPTTPAHFGCLQNYGMLNMNGQQPYTPRNIGFPGVIGERSQMFSPNSGSWSSSANRVGPSTTFGGRGAHHEGGSGQHNIVSIEKIANGTDVRTTVMLRNIPNKMHLPDLKKFVDRSSFGKYDFIYLRIDFQNDCNVGYAFINFENSESIINFMLDINNTTWAEFHSKKVAEVSYATIQGKDCLIQKFRNSSVMKEFDGYRPKLYYTESDPRRCGQEAPFPPPDNWSKVKRSIDNAQHIGLFPPRAGQQTRNEQRHRRSQFDRGTPRAQLEESHDHSNNLQALVPFGYPHPNLDARNMFPY